jgi:hypothetical protein
MAFYLHAFFPAQTSSKAFLSFKISAGRKLANYNRIQANCQKLERESPKLKIITIKSKANMAKLTPL